MTTQEFLLELNAFPVIKRRRYRRVRGQLLRHGKILKDVNFRYEKIVITGKYKSICGLGVFFLIEKNAQ